MTPTRLEIINIGDELLLGIRSNSHLTFLGEKFSQHGQPVQRATVVLDEAEEIERNFLQSWEQSDVLVLTGGLGPTSDDNTREVVAKALGLKLVHSDEVEAHIRRIFERRKRQVTENNLKQAKVLQNAEVLHNPLGTAPGQWLEKDGKILVMLPGPTREMEPMFLKQVLPRLSEAGQLQEQDSYLQLRTIGVGESKLENMLQPIFDDCAGRLAVAYCARQSVVDLRLCSLRPKEMSRAEIREVGERCREALGPDFVCYGNCSLSELVLLQVRSLGRTLAVAESCTGGLLSDALTNSPGSSKAFIGGVVSYTNQAKVEIVGVPEVIIQQHSAVSAECAVAMATGVAEKFGSDYGLSVTGYAGPGGGTSADPVGTVYIGYHSPMGAWCRKEVIMGDRLAVKRKAAQLALDWMRRKMKKYEVEEVLECLHC